MKKLLEKMEQFSVTPTQWILGVASIIIIRMILESFSGNSLEIYPFVAIFTQPPLIFVSMTITFALFLHFFTKTPLATFLKMSVFALPFLLLAPTIDFIASGGKGNIRIQYIFAAWPELVQKFFTFFGSNFTLGVTYGARTQIVAIVAVATYFVYYKTHKIWKTVVGAIVSYTITFFYASLPALFGALTYLPRKPWEITEIEIAQRFFISRSIFGIHFTPEKIQSLFSIEIGLVLLPIFIINILLMFFFIDRKKFKEFFKHLRYLRLFFHWGALIAGILLGMKIFHMHFDTSVYGILMALNLIIIVTAIWIFSLTTNDRNDVAIDKISNQERLLPRGIFTPKEFQDIGLIALIIAVIGSILAGYPFTMLTLGSLAISFMYSSPPFRIRYWPILSHGFMAIGSTFLIMMGFLLFASSGTLFNFPINFFALFIIVITLVMNLKDIKDVAGDKPNDVMTIPTMFGLERSKTIIAILFCISYLLFPLLLRAPQIFPTAIVFGLLTAFLIKMKKVHEGWIFAIYSLFVVVISLLIF